MNTRITSFTFPLLFAFSVASAMRAATPHPPEWAAPGALAFTDEVAISPLTAGALRKTLPLRGDRLAGGKPYHIVAIGDAVLDDWPALSDTTAWFPVGKPVQARLVRGPSDSRKIPAECYAHWSIKAGREGIWFAFRATGNISKDSFSLFFDARPPSELGAAGPFAWVDGSIKPDGRIVLMPGDTFINTGAKLAALYKTTGTQDGAITTAKVFVPYDVLGATAWPESGDLGLSIIWTHPYADGRVVTRLLWLDNGYRWNPHWSGVARRDPATPLPCMMRIQ